MPNNIPTSWTNRWTVLRAAIVGMLLVAAPAVAQGTPAHPSFRVAVSGHGKAMILIPGLASSGDTWKSTVEHYQNAYQCHVLTLAGFAGVPAIQAPLLSTVRDQLASYIRANHLGRPVIVGHSLGGSIAMDLAAHDPDLVGPVVVVDSLPFMAGALFDAKTIAEAKPMIEGMHGYMVNQTREQYEAYAREGASTKYMVTSASDLETIKKWGLESDQKTVANAMYELLNEDLRPELTKIESPVLVLGTWRGLHDQMQAYNKDLDRASVVTTFAEQFKSVPRLHFAISDTTRHFIMFDDPKWFFAQLDAFLSNPSKAVEDRGFAGQP